MTTFWSKAQPRGNSIVQQRAQKEQNWIKGQLDRPDDIDALRSIKHVANFA